MFVRQTVWASDGGCLSTAAYVVSPVCENKVVMLLASDVSFVVVEHGCCTYTASLA